jgi:hypothetical protein
MAPKAEQIIACGAGSLARQSCTSGANLKQARAKTTISIHDPFREAQRHLNRRRQQRDKSRVSRAGEPGVNQSLDQWLSTVVTLVAPKRLM